jgi:hypothetical protein
VRIKEARRIIERGYFDNFYLREHVSIIAVLSLINFSHAINYRTLINAEHTSLK